MPRQSHVRVSDRERDLVVELLRENTANGRLAAHEFEQRVEEVHDARVIEDLESLVQDLPVSLSALLPTQDPESREVIIGTDRPAGTTRSTAERAALHTQWTHWALVNAVCLLIWGIVATQAGELPYFWPVWVIGPWGVLLLGRSLLSRIRA